MKQLFTAFLFSLLFLTATYGQQKGTENNQEPFRKFVIRDSIAMSGVPRDELYSRSWRWFEEVAKTNPSLLKEANKRWGRFTGTPYFTFISKLNGGSDYVKGKIYYSMRVYVENEYYICEFTDFTHLARISFNTITTHSDYPYRVVVNKEWHDLVWREMKEQSQKEAAAWFTSLKGAMEKETEKFGYYKQLWERDPANAKLDLN